MHEMALAEGVREIVEGIAREHSASGVRTVRLRIGALAAVDPQALRFCFDAVMAGSLAAGAALEIAIAPGSAWCWDCDDAVTIVATGGACPRCRGHRLQVTDGTDMRVADVELIVSEETATCA